MPSEAVQKQNIAAAVCATGYRFITANHTLTDPNITFSNANHNKTLITFSLQKPPAILRGLLGVVPRLLVYADCVAGVEDADTDAFLHSIIKATTPVST